MLKTYKISLKLRSGILTELQSDTIFGHFCWRMKELKTEKTLLDFLDLYTKQEPLFTVSNSFFGNKENIYVPVPFIPSEFQNNDKSKEQKVIDFLKFKIRKKIRFLTLPEFNSAMMGDRSGLDKLLSERLGNNENQPGYETDLRVSVEINRNTFSSKEGQLFSYAPKYLKKNNILNIFIKVIDEEKFNSLECSDILKETFEIGFGKKKSSGYGEFEIIEFKEFTGFTEPTDANAFISLSNYLPSRLDKIKDAFYETKVKYGKLGEEYALSENPFKKPIIFLTPGSVFKTDIKKDFYGRCTNIGEISSIPSVIQNGIAFTLKAKI
jgi:CRISPR-associated protein Csm4